MCILQEGTERELKQTVRGTDVEEGGMQAVGTTCNQHTQLHASSGYTDREKQNLTQVTKVCWHHMQPNACIEVKRTNIYMDSFS